MRILYVLILATLLFAGYLLKDNLQPVITKQVVQRQQALHNDEVESFMRDATTLKTTDEGKPKMKMRMHGARQLHNGETLLDKPYIIVYNDVHNPPWTITAGYGYTDNRTRTLHLKENVKLTQRQSPSTNVKRVLTTSELLIFPKRRYATTDKPVTITEPDSQLHAVGLRANFKTDNIELLSEVKGQMKGKAKAKT